MCRNSKMAHYGSDKRFVSAKNQREKKTKSRTWPETPRRCFFWLFLYLCRRKKVFGFGAEQHAWKSAIGQVAYKLK